MKLIIFLVGLMVSLNLVGCGEKPKPLTPPAELKQEVAGDLARAPLRILSFNQDSTRAGQAFNVQKDGNSGITFVLSSPAPATGVAAWFDDRPLTGVVARDSVVTATIPADYLRTPGTFPLALDIPGQPSRMVAGNFIVQAP